MGFILLVSLILPLFVFILWLGCLISCISNNSLEGDRRILWFLVIFFIPFIGSILYILMAPKSVKISHTSNNVQQKIASNVTYASQNPESEGFSLLRVLIAVPVVILVLVIGIPLLVSSKSSAKYSGPLAPTESTKKAMTSNLRNALVAQEAYFVEHNRYLTCKNARCAVLPGFNLDERFGIEFEQKGNQLIASSWIKGDINSRVNWTDQKGIHGYTF